MRKLILNLHLYTALVAGLFIVILGVTGSIIAFEVELDHVFNRSLYKVVPTSQPLPVADVIGDLKAAYPHQKFSLLTLPSAPDMAYVAHLRRSQIFINGYTGKIIGTRPWPTPLQDIHQLHIRLLMGQSGSNIVCVVGFIVVWLVISGVYLWWPLKRVKVKFGASFRRVTFDLHNVIGIYTAVFLLILAVTGIIIHFDHTLEASLNHAVHAPRPLRLLPSTAQAGASPITPDHALQIAKAALPGAAENLLQLPAGRKGSYLVIMGFPEDLTAAHSWVTIDQYSGKVLYVESSRNESLGTHAIHENRAIHTGQIYGYPTKILMALVSILVVIQVITGYCMWWKKLRSVQDRKPRAEAVSETVV